MPAPFGAGLTARASGSGDDDGDGEAVALRLPSTLLASFSLSEPEMGSSSEFSTSPSPKPVLPERGLLASCFGRPAGLDGGYLADPNPTESACWAGEGRGVEVARFSTAFGGDSAAAPRGEGDKAREAEGEDKVEDEMEGLPAIEREVVDPEDTDGW